MEFLSILAQFGIALLGMVFVIYGKFITTPNTNTFSWPKFKEENLKAVILTAIGIPLIFAIMLLVPEAALILQKGLGLNFQFTEIENGSSFTLGVFLYSTIRNLNKKA